MALLRWNNNLSVLSNPSEDTSLNADAGLMQKKSFKPTSEKSFRFSPTMVFVEVPLELIVIVSQVLED